MSPILKNLSDDDIEILASGAQIKSFRRGQVAFEQTARATDFAIVVEGTVKSSFVTPQGHELLLAVFVPGETVGWQALLGGKEYTFSASAFRDVSLAMWKGRELRATLERHPAIALDFFEAIIERTNGFLEHCRQLLTSSAEQRLGYIVTHLAERFGETAAAGIRLKGFTEEELAAMAGLNRFTVSRLLRRWRDNKLIMVNRRNLLIRDLAQITTIRDEPAAAS